MDNECVAMLCLRLPREDALLLAAAHKEQQHRPNPDGHRAVVSELLTFLEVMRAIPTQSLKACLNVLPSPIAAALTAALWLSPKELSAALTNVDAVIKVLESGQLPGITHAVVVHSTTRALPKEVLDAAAKRLSFKEAVVFRAGLGMSIDMILGKGSALERWKASPRGSVWCSKTLAIFRAANEWRASNADEKRRKQAGAKGVRGSIVALGRRMSSTVQRWQGSGTAGGAVPVRGPGNNVSAPPSRLVKPQSRRELECCDHPMASIIAHGGGAACAGDSKLYPDNSWDAMGEVDRYTHLEPRAPQAKPAPSATPARSLPSGRRRHRSPRKKRAAAPAPAVPPVGPVAEPQRLAHMSTSAMEHWKGAMARRAVRTTRPVPKRSWRQGEPWRRPVHTPYV